MLTEDKAEHKVEEDEKDEHTIHRQVDTDIGPVLPVEFFQSLEHIHRNLREGNDSFSGSKNHKRSPLTLLSFIYVAVRADRSNGETDNWQV